MAKKAGLLKNHYQKQAVRLNQALAEQLPAETLRSQETVLSRDLWKVLCEQQLFGHNVIRKLFFNGRHPYVPRLLIRTYRDSINRAPQKCRQLIVRIFRRILGRWSLWSALEQFLSAPAQSLRLESVSDFSIGAGVYCLEFSQKGQNTNTPVFIKREFPENAYLNNEPLYFTLQNQLCLQGRSNWKTQYFQGQQGPPVLLSAMLPGCSADIFFSRVLRLSDVKLKHKYVQSLFFKQIAHMVLGDILGRTDRNLGNTHCFSWKDPQQYKQIQQVSDQDLVDQLQEDLDQGQLALINYDIQYLLHKDNYAWVSQDIAQGLSELNLLQLFIPNFFDANCDQELRDCLNRIIEAYRQNAEKIREQKPWIYQKLSEHYDFAEKDSVLELFEQRIEEHALERLLQENLRSLLVDYRIRWHYKMALQNFWCKHSEHQSDDLCKYTNLDFSQSVAHSLEAFRGLSSRSFQKALGLKERLCWEDVQGLIEKLLPEDHLQDLQRTAKQLQKQASRILSL